MERRDGFDDQRMEVVPRPLVAEALDRPVNRRLLVTDAGYFPVARDHRRSRPHGTPEAIIIVCTAGSGWVQAGDQRHRVGSSSAVVLAAGEPHAYGADDGTPWSIWWCHIRGSDVDDLVSMVGTDAVRPVLALRAVGRVTALLDEIVTTLESDQSPARLLATSGMAWRMLTQLAVDRFVPEQGEPLGRAIAHLTEHLDRGVPVPELAALVGVSPSHLSALFRRATGGGVTAHHLVLRMARARTLLDTTELPIGAVGRAVGFDDQFYFSRQFHRAHGLSPSAYRAEHKG